MFKSLSAILRAAAALLLMIAAGETARAQQMPDAPTPTIVIADNVLVAPLPGNPASPFAAHSAAVIAKTGDRIQSHRFFDKTNWMLLGVETAALTADGITTQNRLGNIHTEYQLVNGVSTPVQMRVTEANPIGKVFVNHGWPGTIAGGVFTVGADLGVQYLLHRTHHHKLERIVPMLFAASNTFAAIHNTHY